MEGEEPKKKEESSVPGGRREGRKRGEDGFEEWGGYMGAKRAKLDLQFHGDGGGGGGSGIFSGISIHINGYTDPPERELRGMFTRNGGKFTNFNNGAMTNYIIATNLSAPSKRLYGAKTLRPEWITESVAAGRLLDPRGYFLYDLNKENKQGTLSLFVKATSSSSSSTATSSTETLPSLSTVSAAAASTSTSSAATASTSTSSAATASTSTSSAATASTSTSSAATASTSSREKRPYVIVDELDIIPSSGSTVASLDPNESTEDENDFLPASDEEEEKSRTKLLSQRPPKKKSRESTVSTKSPVKTTSRPKTASEEGFLEDFFANSRLHLISSHKKAMQNKIGRLRQSTQQKGDAEANFPLLGEFSRDLEGHATQDGRSLTGKTLMHVDLDCFFVSAGLLSRPHLVGLPVVVTHSTKGDAESRADIASASYEARRRGVRNGMWVGEAKKLCPSLNVIPYDFAEYKRISELFFATVAKLTLEIEVGSVDEMLVDVTAVLQKLKGATPVDLAQFIRKHIKEATKCTASIGIGSNRLLAKLATKRAKPDGVFHLEDSAAAEFIGQLEAGDLPGVGYSTQEKLHSSGVSTCADLLTKLPLHRLQSIVGNKTATKLLEFCKGRDSGDLQLGYDRPKSLSVDVNFGIRFEEKETLDGFLAKLCAELSRRAEEAEATCRSLTLKVLTRRKGAGMPLKQGGHGIVDATSKSTRFHVATRSADEFVRNVRRMMGGVLSGGSVGDLRGIGLTMGDLTFAFDDGSDLRKTKKSGGPQQKSIFESFSRGMRMVNTALGRTAMTPTPTSTVTMAAEKEAKSNVNSVAVAPPEEEKLDFGVLRELPREVRQEIAQHYGIDFNLVSTPPVSSKTAVNVDVNPPTVETSSATSTSDADVNFLTEKPPSPQPGPSRRLLVPSVEPSSPPTLKRRIKVDELDYSSSESSDEETVDAFSVSSASPSDEEFDAASSSSEDEFSEERQLAHEAKVNALLAESESLPEELMWEGLPALSGRFLIPDVRNLLREGICAVASPSPEDVADLHAYFTQLIQRGFLHQTSTLLKFLTRQLSRLQDSSPWVSVIDDIIANCQDTTYRHFDVHLDIRTDDVPWSKLPSSQSQ